MSVGEKNIHKNHRRRMMDKVYSDGFESLYPHEALEVLLFFLLPRVNTNYIGHYLIERFGSLQNVLRADKNDLMKVRGIGEVSAERLANAADDVSECIKEQFRNEEKLTIYSIAFLADWFMRGEEKPVGIMLNSIDGRFYDFGNLPLCRREDGCLDFRAMTDTLDDIPVGSCSLFVREAELFSPDDICEIRRVTFGMSLVLDEIYLLRGREPVPILE